MNNPKQLTLSAIRHACSESSYERGRNYYLKGQVVKLTVSSDGALFVQLNSSVKGSVKTPYNQNIRIVWRPDYSAATIEGDCSCPVGYNCKHVAAVCLMYQDSIQTVTTAMDSSCLDWLASLDKPEQAFQHNAHEEFIAYVLKPGRQPYEFMMEFYLTKEKKAGGLSKGRQTTLNNLRYSYMHMPAIQPEDVEITILLFALSNAHIGEPPIRGAAGSVALSKLARTGRLYWQDFEQSSPLKAADARELRLDWKQQQDGACQLEVAVEPEALLILTDPPYYLDTELGTIGTVDAHNLSADQLKKVLSAPLIPPEHVETFSERLIVDHPGLPLPPPRKIELIEVNDLTPTPRLTLLGRPIDDHYVHFMALEFIYGQWALPALAHEPYSVVKTNRKFLRIRRDTATEQLTIDRLAELEFADAGVAHPRERVFFSRAKSPLNIAAHWGDFLLNVLPELEQEGWLIDTDESFRLNFQAAETWDVEISESPYDWFEMRFNVDIDGQSLPLLPLIMPVLEYYDLEDLPERLNLHIGDHRYLTLPSEKIKPFLAILIELFNSNSALANDGALRLSRFNAGSLADMEAHNYGLFRLSGGEALRELGQKLKSFTGIENVAPPAGLKAELRNYQRHGLNWLQFLREYRFGGILADDMGLGKTVQALAHLLLEKQSGRMTAPCLNASRPT
jgi:hypothetical protein